MMYEKQKALFERLYLESGIQLTPCEWGLEIVDEKYQLSGRTGCILAPTLVGQAVRRCGRGDACVFVSGDNNDVHEFHNVHFDWLYMALLGFSDVPILRGQAQTAFEVDGYAWGKEMREKYVQAP